MGWTWLYVIVGTASAVLNFLVLFFWKPWAKAYADEKAKNYARKEDLDKILAEVRAVTATAEAIKADINGGLWERQMCWNQKRDLYAELIKTVTEMLYCYRELRSITAPEFSSLGSNLHSLTVMAYIFTNSKCTDVLEAYLKPHPKTASRATTEESLRAEVQLLTTLQRNLIVAAKADLGLYRNEKPKLG